MFQELNDMKKRYEALDDEARSSGRDMVIKACQELLGAIPGAQFVAWTQGHPWRDGDVSLFNVWGFNPGFGPNGIWTQEITPALKMRKAWFGNIDNSYGDFKIIFEQTPPFQKASEAFDVFKKTLPFRVLELSFDRDSRVVVFKDGSVEQYWMDMGG